jgi:hypothetical protein
MSYSFNTPRRYIENARSLLREKACKEEGYYQDTKYVRLAGHAAYSGVLLALDRVLGAKRKGRKSVEWYKEELGKIDKKMLSTFVSAYEVLHLSMSYDGIPDVEIAQTGLKRADQLIDWAEARITV